MQEQAVAGAVVGEQGADADAMAGEELDSGVEEADGGSSLLIG
uniref:Rhox homeobox family member 2 (Paired-like homeobox protein PEPP-2) (Testis homeobox gene 1) n=1 Tax=mine drainage metagenome TaxID=410659 RepID=E6QIR1_9ZZZZ